MIYGYYPGCSLHATAKEYDMATRVVCKAIGISLNEVDDWVCCGATPAHTTSEELGIALPMVTVASATKQGLSSIIAPCAACYNRLKSAIYAINNSVHTQQRISEVIGDKLNGEIEIKIMHPLEFLRVEYGYKKIKELVKRPLTELKVACYYGCLLVRPPKVVNFDDAEDPTSMDNLIQAIGGTSVTWSHKTECCGASHAIPQPDIVLELTHSIFNSARSAGADCIAVGCPLCHANLDMRMGQVNKRFGTDFNIPILYITQLLGISMDIPFTELGIKSHLVSPIKMLKARKLI
jgi:heterodisulfide reductase subunit B